MDIIYISSEQQGVVQDDTLTINLRDGETEEL